MTNPAIIALLYLLAGLPVGAFIAWSEGEGGEPQVLGLVGMFLWPLALIVAAALLLVLPFFWLFGKIGEIGGRS